MELTQLQTFLCVAAEGSITRAAERVSLTQPAVTHQMRALEKELGVALLERTGRGVRLTEAGTALRDYAQRSLALLGEGRRLVADLAAGRAGRVLLGAGVTTAIFQLPKWLARFRRRCPGVEVAIRTGHSREVAGLILDRALDLGLVTSPVTEQDLEAVELLAERIVLVAPAEHHLAGRRLKAAALRDLPLLLFPPESGFRAYLDQRFAEIGLTPQVKMETDSAEAIKSFVSAGLGLSFLPASAVTSELRAGTLREVKLTGLPPLRRHTSVIYRKDRYLSRAARLFLEVLTATRGKRDNRRP